jgi:two-component system KDP operon response regulator KdpE
MNEKKNKILIVDDEPQIRKMLNIFLEGEDYRTEESDCGKQAVRMINSTKPDLVLLDLGLPDMDGKEVVAAVREWSQVPIIILSVRSLDEEIVQALDLGADDYVVKPFNADVLIARIKANLRKSAVRETGASELVVGNIKIDLVRHEVFVDNVKASLTPKEYELLRYFMVNQGRMLTHRQILETVWGPAHRDSPEWIVTEPGVGYRFENRQSESAKAA